MKHIHYGSTSKDDGIRLRKGILHGLEIAVALAGTIMLIEHLIIML